MNNCIIIYILFTCYLFCNVNESTLQSKKISYKNPDELLSYIDSVKKQYGQNSYTESILFVETVDRIKKADGLFLKILRKQEYRRQFETCSLLTEAVICEIMTNQNILTLIDQQRNIISYLHELNMSLKEINVLGNTKFIKELENERKRLEEERKQVEEERKQVEEKRKQIEEERKQVEEERKQAEEEQMQVEEEQKHIEEEKE